MHSTSGSRRAIQVGIIASPSFPRVAFYLMSVSISFVTALVILCALPKTAVSQVTIQEARDSLRQLKKAARTRGEFETTEAYRKRRQRVATKIDSLVHQTYRAEARAEFGRYRANEEILPVRLVLAGFVDTLQLRVAPDIAKAIKRKPGTVPASGSFWLEHSGTVFLHGKLNLTVGDSTVEITERPTELRIVGRSTLVGWAEEPFDKADFGGVSATAYRTRLAATREHFVIMDPYDEHHLAAVIDLGTMERLEWGNEREDCIHPVAAPNGASLVCRSGRASGGGYYFTVVNLAEQVSRVVKINSITDVLSFAIGPGGRKLASQAGVWDLRTKQQISSFKYEASEANRERCAIQFGVGSMPDVLFSPDGAKVAVNCRDGNGYFVFDPHTGRQIFGRPSGERSPLNRTAVKFSPDGNILVEKNYDPGDTQSSLIMRSSSDGSEVRTLAAGGEFNQLKIGNRLYFSPEGRLVVASRQDGGMVVWRVRTGEKIRVEGRRSYAQVAEDVQPWGFTADGDLLVYGSREVGGTYGEALLRLEVRQISSAAKPVTDSTQKRGGDKADKELGMAERRNSGKTAIRLAPKNNSGITGKAVIEDKKQGFTVRLMLAGVEPSARYTAYISKGRCDGDGEALKGLGNMWPTREKVESTTVFATDLPGNEMHFIEVRLPDNTLGACANVPEMVF